MTTTTARPVDRARSFFTWFTVLALVVISGALLYRGYDFYRLKLDARIDHPDYRVLRPGGVIGHGYGIAGTALILTNLLYLARRKLAWLPVGSMARWLDLHVVTGLVGSALVLFHSAFQLRNAVATVTAVSLAIVVVTGLVGRSLFGLLPKAGHVPLEERLEELEGILPTFAASVRDAVHAVPCTRLAGDASLMTALATVPRWLIEARRRRGAVRRVARADEQLERVRKKERKFVRGLVTDVAKLAASEVDAVAGQSLLRSWRSVHRFMAILMVVAVTVHVAVAWVYGYRWIFS